MIELAAPPFAMGLPKSSRSAFDEQADVHIRVGCAERDFHCEAVAVRDGGPGSIWKIDGATARVSLFADVTTNGRANSGAALGGLAFDPELEIAFRRRP